MNEYLTPTWGLNVAPQFDIFVASAGLLAFVLAFYALIAHEKRTPYITISIYKTTLLVLGIIALAAFAELFDSLLVRFLAHLLFLFAVIHVIHRIWKVHNRHIHFKDDKLLNNLSLVRWIKEKYRTISKTPAYEHTPTPISNDLAKTLGDLFQHFSEHDLTKVIKDNAENKFSTSIVIRVSSHNDCSSVLFKLVHAFLDSNCAVQYMACSRHPAEFIVEFDKASQTNSICLSNKDKFVVIDAHTNNYGFTDSVYPVWDHVLTKDHGLEVVKANGSFAGMHSAAAKAFNVLKHKSDERDARGPTLVIYECPFAVSDIESIEQYRTFIRHVLPSEKLWGGMLTIVIETSIDKSDWDILTSYADISFNLKELPSLGKLDCV